MTAGSPSSTTPSSSIDRAFRLLQIVVAADQAIGVRELGRRSGLPRSTVSRLVATLADLGMVARTTDGQVVAGSALATLQPAGTLRVAEPTMTDRLRPLLAELVAGHGEHAALAVDDGDEVRYLAQVSAEQPVSAPDVVGERQPFHVVAPGLVAMAWWNPVRLDAYLADPLDAPTDHSVIDPEVVRRRLVAAQVDRWVWTDQELDDGVNGLAVPVIDRDGGLLAIVSLYGPSYRFGPEHHPRLGPSLRDAVGARAAALLGWS